MTETDRKQILSFGDNDNIDLAASQMIDLEADGNLLLDYDSYEEPDEDAEESSPVDALAKCINKFGYVDICWIAERACMGVKETGEALRGLIYRNPDAWSGREEDGWEMADEYLSGNIRVKLTKARIANKRYLGQFDYNIRALKKLLPPELSAEEIVIPLGSPLLTTEIVDDFINYLFDLPPHRRYSGTRHDELTGSWEIPDKERFSKCVRAKITYGTDRVNGIQILQDRLNHKITSPTDEVRSDSSKTGTVRIVNQEEAAAANEKGDMQEEEFRKWLWSDDERKYYLLNKVSRLYDSNVTRRFDGSMLELPGLAEGVTLFSYIRDHVAAIVFGAGCTLLAMDTGAGKTYVMIISAMELIRLGLAKKCMFVVPTDLVGQWHEVFMRLYPDAKVLTVDSKNYSGNRKDRVLQDIRDNDYDGIIIAYSCFDDIPLSRQHFIKHLTEERDKLEKALREKKDESTSRLRKRYKNACEKLGKAAVAEDASKSIVCFDQLGIDRLYIDEAHTYKNLSIETSIKGVYGISTNGSDKCNGMLEKVYHIQKKNHGGGVVMATGTPVTNSITDLFVFQKYLQNGTLEAVELSSFDAWTGMFAKQKTEFEIAVDTSTYRQATRFSEFHNIPQLTSMLSKIARFQNIEEREGIPAFTGYKDVIVTRSAYLRWFLEDISRRADKVHKRKVKRTEDNMLKITIDGRLAALDIRLVRPEITDPGPTKVSECAERAALIYFKTRENRSTQLIFCDSSTPKKGFNVYDELKRMLIFYGVRAEEIAFIHDAKSAAKRDKLFRDFRAGRIRILVGSSPKLGLGVNVQDKIIAVHHLDIPWKPAEWVQREARAFRPGNENSEVDVYRYITEGSFDAYSWQILETKQSIIENLLSGMSTSSTCLDVDDAVLTFAEVKALTVGNPLLRQRFEVSNELRRVTALRNKHAESHTKLELRNAELPGIIADKQREYTTCCEDAKYTASAKAVLETTRAVSRKKAAQDRRELRNKISEELQHNVMMDTERKAAEYRGFSIILPAAMSAEYPYVLLERAGRYRVYLGNKELRILTRIDNEIDGLQERADLIGQEIDSLYREKIENDRELALNPGYDARIRQLKAKLRVIEAQLGVTA